MPNLDAQAESGYMVDMETFGHDIPGSPIRWGATDASDNVGFVGHAGLGSLFDGEPLIIVESSQ